jgi:drug/metabolite transporter (DMT)-like permease
MPNALAVLASLLWGSADFVGGVSAKRLDVKRVGALAQGTGLLVITVVLFLVPGEPHARDLLWGLAAGIATATGVTMLYEALAIGPMYVAASITAVVGAASNATFGLVGGERPGGLASIGIPLAIASVMLVSTSPVRVVNSVRISRVVLLLAGGAGLSLGISNACFAATSPASGPWPVAASRLVATIILLIAALATGSRRWNATGVRYSVAAGVADIAATTSIAYALQRGPQVLVGVLGSLFPVITVVLARIVLHESMNRRQMIGLVCAVAAVALISSS